MSHINSKLLFLIKFKTTCFDCLFSYQLALSLDFLRQWSRWELWSIHLRFLFFGISWFLNFTKKVPWHPIWWGVKWSLMLWSFPCFKSEAFIKSDLVSYLIILNDHHIDWCSWYMWAHIFWQQYHFLFIMVLAQIVTDLFIQRPDIFDGNLSLYIFFIANQVRGEGLVCLRHLSNINLPLDVASALAFYRAF
jgi:hypothetical protein